MATSYPKGGYDYDFVDRPPKSLECSICLLTLRDPHVISCCGNEFCQACIEKVQSSGRPCPLCNEKNFTTFLHKKLVREVNSLPVRCPHKDVGCEWIGELEQLEKHLNSESSSDGCGYEIVDCVNQCGMRIERRMIDEHTCDAKNQIAYVMQKYTELSTKVDTLSTECDTLRQGMKSLTIENQTLRQEISRIRENFYAQMGIKGPGALSQASPSVGLIKVSPALGRPSSPLLSQPRTPGLVDLLLSAQKRESLARQATSPSSPFLGQQRTAPLVLLPGEKREPLARVTPAAKPPIVLVVSQKSAISSGSTLGQSITGADQVARPRPRSPFQSLTAMDNNSQPVRSTQGLNSPTRMIGSSTASPVHSENKGPQSLTAAVPASGATQMTKQAASQPVASRTGLRSGK